MTALATACLSSATECELELEPEELELELEESEPEVDLERQSAICSRGFGTCPVGGLEKNSFARSLVQTSRLVELRSVFHCFVFAAQNGIDATPRRFILSRNIASFGSSSLGS